MRAASLAFVALLSFAGLAPAQSGGNPTPTPEAPAAAAEPSTAPAMLAKYHPTEGTAKLGSMAEARLPAGWWFLGGADGRRFLTDLGNQPGPETLGVAIPGDFAESHVFAVYSYADEGHVDDEEAPDYDQLLADMKASAAEQSKARTKAGLGTVALLGWAEPPHYDKAQHKLYWAEKLLFGGNDGLTLNYNVRVLGRTGHLVVNGVGDIEQLPLVAEHSKQLLQATEFVAGQRYQDFDPSYDKVAAYGIGGLIAGGIATKVGLFAKLALLLKAFLKPILVGVVLLVGAVVKVFTGRKAPDKQAPAA